MFCKFQIQIRPGSGTNETQAIRILFDSNLIKVKKNNL